MVACYRCKYSAAAAFFMLLRAALFSAAFAVHYNITPDLYSIFISKLSFISITVKYIDTGYFSVCCVDTGNPKRTQIQKIFATCAKSHRSIRNGRKYIELFVCLYEFDLTKLVPSARIIAFSLSYFLSSRDTYNKNKMKHWQMEMLSQRSVCVLTF